MLMPDHHKNRPQLSALPLSMVAQGETVLIQGIRGGHRVRQRLLDLGMNQGARIRIMQSEMPGPLIVAVKEDGRLALGRGMSNHIMVTMDVDEDKSGGP